MATPTGKATSSPTPIATPTPHATPTPIRTAPPTPTPSPFATYYPADTPSKLRSSYGRIALAQIFDQFPSTNAQMSAGQIQSDAGRYDFVWGAFQPQAWRGANGQMLVSRYYIMEEDNELVSGHNLAWFQQNHPDWILYACDSSGNPTHDYAYTPGDGFPDVPLDLHNPAVVSYQVGSLISYAQANNYNAIALDNVLFKDVMLGGNPELGQTEKSGEFGCGIWNADGTFTKIYASPTDPTWTQDVLNWVASARQSASGAGLALIVNHPVGSISDPNEQALIRNVDATVDESGFSDYGNYQSSTSLFGATYRYLEWVEQQGVAAVVIDRYTLGAQTSPTSDQIEYSIATYLMANEGNEELFVDANNSSTSGYGTEQYHQEYAMQIGPPCSAMYGGSSYDASNPQIYYRRFEYGLVIVNSGSSASEQAKLPTDHVYQDLEGRSVSNPLTVNSDDAYVLTTGGNGCT